VLDQGELPGIAISPDGRWVAFVGRDGESTSLFLRPLDGYRAHRVPESEGAISPFFSPEGRWVAYQRNTALWKAPVNGGAPTRIGGITPIARGYGWSRPEEITVTWSKRAGLFGLSVQDGSIRAITSLTPDDDEVVHNWAQLLPGGEVLATVVGRDASSYDEGRIVIIDPGNGFKKVVVEGGYYGRLLPDDILVYARAGKLHAVRVDHETWETTGPAVPVLEGFLTDPNTGTTWVGFSDDGVLVYAPGGAYEWQTGRLVWLDRDGSTEPVLSGSRPYRFPRISPDGTRVLFTLEAVHDDIWVYEFERGSMRRLTFDKRNMVPIWRPGTDEISFASVGDNDRSPTLYSLAVDGRSKPSRLVEGYEGTLFCNSWSPDGSTLAFVDWKGEPQFDILLSTDGGTAEPEPFVQSRFDEHSPMFSPDGGWIAYVSNESGAHEVYVVPVAGVGGKYRVSPNGGVSPVWNPEGGELFYREGSRLMAVSIRTGSEPSIGPPRFLFEMPQDVGRLRWVTHFDVSRDGRRFITVVRDPVADVREIRIVHDWFADVEAKLNAAGS
jgi:serine/threonine-protein kinase